MGQGGFRVRQLPNRMGVAIQGKDTTRLERVFRQRVVDVLARRIAVDLDCTAARAAAAKTEAQSATTPARTPIMRPLG